MRRESQCEYGTPRESCTRKTHLGRSEDAPQHRGAQSSAERKRSSERLQRGAARDFSGVCLRRSVLCESEPGGGGNSRRIASSATDGARYLVAVAATASISSSGGRGESELLLPPHIIAAPRELITPLAARSAQYADGDSPHYRIRLA